MNFNKLKKIALGSALLGIALSLSAVGMDDEKSREKGRQVNTAENQGEEISFDQELIKFISEGIDEINVKNKNWLDGGGVIETEEAREKLKKDTRIAELKAFSEAVNQKQLDSAINIYAQYIKGYRDPRDNFICGLWSRCRLYGVRKYELMILKYKLKELALKESGKTVENPESARISQKQELEKKIIKEELLGELEKNFDFGDQLRIRMLIAYNKNK